MSELAHDEVLVLLKRKFVIKGHIYEANPMGTPVLLEHTDQLPSDAKVFGTDKLDEAELGKLEKAQKASGKKSPVALSELAKTRDVKAGAAAGDA